MAAASDDKRFAIGFAVALALLAVYGLAVRAPLRSATARCEFETRKAQPDVDRYFRSPKATPFARVHDELARRKRALAPRIVDKQSVRYLDEAGIAVKAQAGLAALAALVHQLGQPPRGGGDSGFLSVGQLEIRRSGDDPNKVACEMIFVSSRTNPTATLAGGTTRKAARQTRRRPPRRAPRF